MLDRLRNALLVLRGYELAYETEEYEEEAVAAGPTRSVNCHEDPGDLIAVRAARGGPHGAIVLFQTKSASADPMTVVLKPAVARSFAAGILDAADEADGTSRLHFVPVCPLHDAEEPGDE
ncbi:hypothetical protein [Actinopolymorpha pittospori]|uniref:Uncharacterized protein n=1 Tax=Actinopolymorpha pittospori TaxID=648752 RepID=A0A927MZP3_9ACTN|nr:hypothetical protein [Actinopolymorpha pittospori]MBE1606267.1 hypothetical protein [Actinopolymorpha pittospori]